jgi:hypothetical protein
VTDAPIQQRVTIDPKGMLCIDGLHVPNTAAGEKLLAEACAEDARNGIDLRELVKKFHYHAMVEEFEELMQNHERLMEHFTEDR